MKKSTEFKAYKEALAALSDAKRNFTTISDRLTTIREDEAALLAGLESSKNAHELSFDDAAAMGNLALIDEAAANVHKAKALLDAKENERSLTEKVYDKAEKLLDTQKTETRDCEQWLTIAIGKSIEAEVKKLVGDKVKLAWMCYSKGRGTYSDHARTAWFNSLFPSSSDDDYNEVKQLLE